MVSRSVCPLRRSSIHFRRTAFMSDLPTNWGEVSRKESQREIMIVGRYAVRKCTLASNHRNPILESFLLAKEGRLPPIFCCAAVSKRNVLVSVRVQLRTTTSLGPRSLHDALSGEGKCERGERSRRRELHEPKSADCTAFSIARLPVPFFFSPTSPGPFLFF